jgi:predicted outer membrane protein
MNRIVIAAAALALATGSVYGQTPAEKPAATPAAAAKEVTIVQGPGQASVKEDARHCLEQSTNTDVIKCAEPYLPVKQKKM